MNEDQPIDVLNQEVSHQPQEQVHEQVHEQPGESKQDRNWKEMRKKLDYYEQKIQELEQRSSSKAVEEEDVNVNDDDIVTAKDVKKLAKKMAKEMYHQERARADAETAEDRLRQKYVDFDDVVNEDNVKKLLKEEPELAKVLKATADPFAKGVAAYRYIRMMERANPESVDKQVIRQNLAKPRSTTSIKDSGLDHVEEFANGRLTADMRRKLYEEMRSAQGRS